MAEVLEHTHKEHAQGKFEGPLEVYLDAKGEIVNTVPHKGKCLHTLRFPREQAGGDSTSYEYRPIDDCTGSGLNPATGHTERMRMHGLDTLS